MILRCLPRPTLVFMIITLCGVDAVSSQEQPPDVAAGYAVALRYWGGPTVTLETWWHDPIVIDPQPAVEAQLDLSGLSALYATRDNIDPELRQRLAGKLRDRLAAGDVDDSHYYGHHASAVTKPPLAMRLSVNAVNIVHWQDQGEPTDHETRAGGEPVDLLILPVDDPAPPTVAAALKTIAAIKPRFVLPVGAPAASVAEAAEAIHAFLELGKQQFAIVDVEHNAYAIGAASDETDEPRTSTVLHLTAKPWAPSNELAKLLEKMDAACRASQKVFAHLSARQMNYRPSDGTHTPRWNAEHMTGRQLGFFTQIYAEIQPDAFSHLDLNPAQMPDDYQPAYPDWSGAQQAAQMQRANAYVRRFAYLLDGLPMDERAPGSRWTPRRLLEQMDRHFREHTANVVKKFDLPDWPEK